MVLEYLVRTMTTLGFRGDADIIKHPRGLVEVPGYSRTVLAIRLRLKTGTSFSCGPRPLLLSSSPLMSGLVTIQARCIAIGRNSYG